MSPPPPLHNLHIKRRRPCLPTELSAATQSCTPTRRDLPAIQPENRSATIALLATAALALAGCTISPEQTTAPLTPEQQEAEWRVRKFQSDIVQALDKTDRERLMAASGNKSGTGTANPAVGVNTTTTSPITVSTVALGTRPSQDPVIFASSSNDSTGAQHPAPTPIRTTHVAPTPEADPSPITAPHAVPTWEPLTAAPGSEPRLVASGLPTGEAAPSPNGIVISPLGGTRGSVPVAVIDPFTLPQAPPPSAMVAIASQAPLAVPDPAPTPSLDDALLAVRKMADEHPSLKTALALALLEGDKEGQMRQKLSSADQKIFSDLLAAFESMKATPTNATLSQRTAPILEAATGWQQDADLKLPRLVLASRVDSFGVFSPVANSFEQGKRYTVIIYCEVSNFRSNKGDDGRFSTRLSQQESLITEDGLLVWRPNAEEIEDRSLNQRHDFYLVKKLTIPETLAAGKYSLRMSVTDRHSNKIALLSLPVEIVAK